MPYDGHRNISSEKMARGFLHPSNDFVPVQKLVARTQYRASYTPAVGLVGAGFVERNRKQMGSAGGVALHKLAPSLLQHAAMHEYG